MTYPDDRLPAVGGLAALMAAEMNFRYTAGLWEEDLEGLLWQANYSEYKRTRFSGLTSDAPFPTGTPSWSWVSVRHPITYPFDSGIRVSSPRSASLVATDLGIDSNNTFGKLNGSAIALLAIIKKDSQSWSDIMYIDDKGMSNTRRDDPKPRDAALVVITERTAAADDWRAHSSGPYMLPRPKTYFLVVYPDQIKAGCWRRFGMGWTYEYNIFKDIEPELVTLV